MKLLNQNQLKSKKSHDKAKLLCFLATIKNASEIPAITKTKKILRSKSGFTIMEAIVSLLILSILLTTIVTIIRFSTSMTAKSIASADAAQDRFNTLILEDYIGGVETITFTSDDADIEASHEVDLYNADGIVAFTPTP